MKLTNWRTTLAGIVQLALTGSYQALQASQGADVNWTAVGLSAAMAIIAGLAKDSNVTGGTVQQ